MFYCTANGTSLGNNTNRKMISGTLTSPGFPSYSNRTKTETNCRLTQKNDEAFIMTTLEIMGYF